MQGVLEMRASKIEVSYLALPLTCRNKVTSKIISMKKIFMSIIAVATMTIAMTSCNKEENVTPGDIPFNFENPEVLEQVKTHFVGFDQFWDEGDLISIVDANRNKAYYSAAVNSDGSAHFTFARQLKGNTIDLTGNIEGVYPVSIASAPGYVSLPSRQYSQAGEVNDFPLYANGPLETFEWRNLCGWFSLKLTGDAVIDSMSITTDKYLNGTFSVNIANLSTPLTYKANGGHGTKTNTVRYAEPIQLTSEMKRLNIYLPAGTYNTFKVTLYSNGNTFVVYNNNNPITIDRSWATATTKTANTTDFTPANNVRYNVGTTAEPQYVIFSQGNLEFLTTGREYWRFADNQWGFRGTYQSTTSSSIDRDLFAWGANGYPVAGHNGHGNGISIYNKTAPYFYDGTSLSGVNEWGNNVIANGGNTAWRTLTATEMNNLLANYTSQMVTLSFVGKSGLLILSDQYTGTVGTTITKAEWNELEAAGCVFFPVESYRQANRTIDNTASYYWLNAADATTASALCVGTTATVVTADKAIGGFVRLVKNVAAL